MESQILGTVFNIKSQSVKSGNMVLGGINTSVVPELDLGIVRLRARIAKSDIFQDSASDEDSDIPSFEVDETAPGEFVLLRHHLQSSEEQADDEGEIIVVLGNAGGDDVDGEMTFALESPDSEVTTETLTVPTSEPLPSGAAQAYTVGSFTFKTAGEWSFTATDGIADVHSAYDETITIESPEE